ncbi:MAG: hypothetical protein FK734_19705 [Asgard group archaeon]|nr:hypothetical protein [Asgard group archaeon]
MNTKTKVLLGAFSIICLITIVSITNTVNANYIEPIESDPEDPGNSPGPGLPPDLCSIEGSNSIIQLIRYLVIIFLQGLQFIC